jgi:hypothetical protein
LLAGAKLGEETVLLYEWFCCSSSSRAIKVSQLHGKPHKCRLKRAFDYFVFSIRIPFFRSLHLGRTKTSFRTGAKFAWKARMKGGIKMRFFHLHFIFSELAFGRLLEARVLRFCLVRGGGLALAF